MQNIVKKRVKFHCDRCRNDRKSDNNNKYNNIGSTYTCSCNFRWK